MYKLPHGWQRLISSELEKVEKFVAKLIDKHNETPENQQDDEWQTTMDNLDECYSNVLDELDERWRAKEMASENQAHYDSIWY